MEYWKAFSDGLLVGMLIALAITLVQEYRRQVNK